MIARELKLVSAVGLMLSIGAVLAQEPPSDNVANPFDRPEFVLGLGSPAAVVQAVPPVRLELRATMVGAGSALANINGQTLSAGQTYEGYRVVSIREGHVVLSKNGERLELDVYENQRGTVDGRE